MSDIPDNWTWCATCKFAQGGTQETCSRCCGPAEPLRSTAPVAPVQQTSDNFHRWWVSQHGRPPLPEEADSYELCRALWDGLWSGRGLPARPPTDEVQKNYVDGWRDAAVYVLSRLPTRESAAMMTPGLQEEHKQSIWALLDMRRYLESLACIETEDETPPRAVPPIPCSQCGTTGMLEMFRAGEFDLVTGDVKPGAFPRTAACVYCEGGFTDHESAEMLANPSGFHDWAEDDKEKP